MHDTGGGMPEKFGVPASISFRESSYRPEIDGLRALAVMAVVIFHLNPKYLSGGFIGVDVFFVISGYLITKIIVNEKQRTNHFDFARFYVRRARRLFPAMFVTVLLTTVFAFYLFPMLQLKAYLSEALFTVTSLSNFLFWGQSGYFDADALSKPLLHTWSLAVEEQFYVIWPMFVVFALAKRSARNALLILLSVSLLSYWANVVFVRMGDVNSIFFLMPFRIFEFGFGAAIVWLEKTPVKYKMFNELFVALGLAAIIWPVIKYTEDTIFPTYNALLPCFGAALIIYSGGKSQLGMIFRNKLALGIGVISYSLYLVHWPIVVFFAHIKERLPNVTEAILLLLISIALASIMYFTIEQPFRTGRIAFIKRMSGAGIGFLISLLCLIFAVSTYFVSIHGLRSSVTQLDLEAVFDAGKDYTWARIREQKGSFDDETIGEKVLLIGDSQGADFLNILWAYDPEYAADVRTVQSNKFCQFKSSIDFYESGDFRNRFSPPSNQLEKCSRDVASFAKDQRVEQADTIILAYAWFSSVDKYLELEIAEIRARNPGVKLFVVGRKDQPRSSISYLEREIIPEQANLLARKVPDIEVAEVNQFLSSVNGVEYLDMYATICGTKTCDLFTYSEYPVLFDKRHFTTFGAKYISQSNAFSEHIAGPLGLLDE